MPDGKRRLVEAALRLAARSGDLCSLGVRALGREAGLNPNTFYRHFSDVEALGLAAIEQVTVRLKTGLRDVRHAAVKHADATRGSAEYFFEFVLDNSDAFYVGVREINGPSPMIRQALRAILDEIATDITDDIQRLSLAPAVDNELLLQVCSTIVYELFYQSLDYIQQPRQREQIIESTIRLSRMLFLGAAALQQTRQTQASA